MACKPCTTVSISRNSFGLISYTACYVLGGLSALNLILNEMTVQELINALENLPKDKIVVLTEPDGIGWDNIGQVIEEGSTVKITMDGNHPFED